MTQTGNKLLNPFNHFFPRCWDIVNSRNRPTKFYLKPDIQHSLSSLNVYKYYVVCIGIKLGVGWGRVRGVPEAKLNICTNSDPNTSFRNSEWRNSFSVGQRTSREKQKNGSGLRMEETGSKSSFRMMTANYVTKSGYLHGLPRERGSRLFV